MTPERHFQSIPLRPSGGADKPSVKARRGRPILPLRMRVAGFLLSRTEYVHRALRDLYRTPAGFALAWANVFLWSLYLLSRVLPPC